MEVVACAAAAGTRLLLEMVNVMLLRGQ